MRPIRMTVGVIVLTLACVSQLGLMRQGPAQSQPAASASLRVSGVGLESKRFDAAALRGITRATVSAKEKDGVEVVYEGVRISEILVAAGMTFGQSLRGPRLADYLIAEASDGYRVVFALPELDAEFSDRVVIVADQCEGKALSERDGPLKIIVSDEKRHARWVRNVVSLSVQSAPKAD